MSVIVKLTFHKVSESPKEYVERRHGEPIKFIFLPKMGLLGWLPVMKKKSIMNYELLLSSVFSVFSIMFSGAIFFYIVVSALKSCLISK